jgi:glycine betaine/proline transport system substrate-binding protein
MRRTMLAAAILYGLGAAAAHADDPAACREVRLADIGWTDVAATTALTALLLRDLGYQPRTVALTIPATYQALKAGEVDAFLGNWMPAMEQDRKPFVDDKSIVVLGPNLSGARYTLAVPQYLYDRGLHSFADIHDFGKELNWRIWGIEQGNDGNRHVLDLIRADRDGLGKFQLVESSEQGMLAELDKDYRARRPIVFLGWEPHPMNVLYKIAYLTGGDDTFGPDQGAASVYTNLRTGFAEGCPNAAKLLGNETFTLQGEDEMMNLILTRKLDPAKAAAAWAKAHKDAIRPWLDGVTTLDGKPGAAAVLGKL